ncbi:hypothetical protein Mapa_000578 [Marchantia paleacea]|nr:hypothetical protein Mapa_000578 [Marchantia paleacea]
MPLALHFINVQIPYCSPVLPSQTEKRAGNFIKNKGRRKKLDEEEGDPHEPFRLHWLNTQSSLPSSNCFCAAFFLPSVEGERESTEESDSPQTVHRRLLPCSMDTRAAMPNCLNRLDVSVQVHLSIQSRVRLLLQLLGVVTEITERLDESGGRGGGNPDRVSWKGQVTTPLEGGRDSEGERDGIDWSSPESSDSSETCPVHIPLDSGAHAPLVRFRCPVSRRDELLSLPSFSLRASAPAPALPVRGSWSKVWNDSAVSLLLALRSPLAVSVPLSAVYLYLCLRLCAAAPPLALSSCCLALPAAGPSLPFLGPICGSFSPRPGHKSNGGSAQLVGCLSDSVHAPLAAPPPRLLLLLLRAPFCTCSSSPASSSSCSCSHSHDVCTLVRRCESLAGQEAAFVRAEQNRPQRAEALLCCRGWVVFCVVWTGLD